MEYTRRVGDVLETYKGTPQEIADLAMGLPDERLISMEGTGISEGIEVTYDNIPLLREGQSIVLKEKNISTVSTDDLIKEIFRRYKDPEWIKACADYEYSLNVDSNYEGLSRKGRGPITILILKD